jgi:hypothetical protein
MVGAWSMLVQIVAPTPQTPVEAHTASEKTESPIILLSPPTTQEGASESVRAYVSAYTCQQVAANPMFPCNTTRWGNDPFTHGAACPESWAWKSVQVGGVWYVCDDTPRHSYVNGLPHIDLRLSTYAAAVRWGIQTIEIQVSK